MQEVQREAGEVGAARRIEERELRQEHARQPGIARVVVVEAAEHAHDRVDERQVGVEGRHRGAVHRLDVVLEEPQQQVALLGEVEEQRARADPGLLRDRAGGRRVEAVA